MSEPFVWWGFFGLLIIIMLVIDLGIFNRRAHIITLKEAFTWSAVWIGLALCFNGGILIFQGNERALEFLTGYLIEKSLSVDNLFVFILIFSYLDVPPKYEHKVLFWGIIGAVIMRAFFIAAGITLIHTFHWVVYFFGLFLIYTGIRLGTAKSDIKVRPDKNPVFRIFRKLIPITSTYVEDRFFIREQGKLLATPLFAVILIIETTDVIFALDSIPAILAITTDPFLVYTSNIMAILGLRALFFALAGMMRIFHYLRYGIVIILIFIGIKMLISGLCHIPVSLSLAFIAGILALSVIISIICPPKVEMIVSSPPTSPKGENDSENL